MKIKGGYLNIFKNRVVTGLFNTEHDAKINADYHKLDGLGTVVKTIKIDDFEVNENES